ncbi:MAG: rhodanese-like domain-containing protein [Bdellovibrionales bacterium]
MEIGLFQLENLFLVPSRWVFIDIRESHGPVEPQVESLLRKATPLSRREVRVHLERCGADREAPIVIVCETGASSAEVARELERAGFNQVYIVAGGVAGLLSEL